MARLAPRALEPLALPAPLVRRVTLALPVRPALPALAPRELLVLRGLRELLVARARRARPVLPEMLALRARLVLKVLLVP